MMVSDGVGGHDGGSGDSGSDNKELWIMETTLKALLCMDPKGGRDVGSTLSFPSLCFCSLSLSLSNTHRCN